MVLGTGYAFATECYNTCFAIRRNGRALLVDAGGGNGILRRLKQARILPEDVHEMIVTHAHCDHLLGVVWVVRQVATAMRQETYKGDFFIYCHAALETAIRTICGFTLQKKFTALFDDKIHFVTVTDGAVFRIMDYDVTFFDIHSTKAEQYGFALTLENGKKLACLGDEPYNPVCEKYVRGSAWMLAEAFCLFEQRDLFKPYEKHHSTVKEACELAQRMEAENLVLWHTEDQNYGRRKELYTAEGARYYNGNLFVPYDGERLPL